MRRTTIKDVAAEAGVSFSAVSRAFKDDGRIAKDTRKRVFEAANRLGYRPSPFARNLARGRSGLVTLVTGPAGSSFDALFFDALAGELVRRGSHLMVVRAETKAQLESGLLQAIDYRSEMAIVAAGTMSLELSEQCMASGLPVVLAGRSLSAPGVRCVLADNRDGGRRAGELIGRLGVERFAFFGQNGRTMADTERHEGFVLGVRAAAGDGAAIAQFDAAAGPDPREVALDFLGRSDRPEAVFCSNDGLAIELLQAAAMLGLKVPEDLAVVGFDNVPMAAWPAFRLTTIDYSIARVVEAIMQCLDETIDADFHASLSETRRIPIRLVVRQTTPPPRFDALPTPRIT